MVIEDTEDGVVNHNRGSVRKLLRHFKMVICNPLVTPGPDGYGGLMHEKALLPDHKSYRNLWDVCCIYPTQLSLTSHLPQAIQRATYINQRNLIRTEENKYSDISMERIPLMFAIIVITHLIFLAIVTLIMLKKDHVENQLLVFSCFQEEELCVEKLQTKLFFSRSSPEAKYTALSSGTREAQWLLNFKNYLNHEKIPTVTLVDNRGCLQLAKKKILNERTKQIDVKYQMFVEFVEKRIVRLKCVLSKENVEHISKKSNWKSGFNKISSKTLCSG